MTHVPGHIRDPIIEMFELVTMDDSICNSLNNYFGTKRRAYNSLKPLMNCSDIVPQDIRQVMVDHGWHEPMTYSHLAKQLCEQLNAE